jgi:hypothetical protein
MLEYAANGRHYWSAAEFQRHAQNAAGDEWKLSQKLKELTNSEITAEEFFSAMEKNLQQSKLRLIFFLEDSSHELRSIVEFLNGQLKDMEILIVEARQYQQGNARIVVPWVFGFTEETRVAKRGSKEPIVKGEAEFWKKLKAGALTDEWKDRISEFVTSAARISDCEVTYQRSCIISLPNVVPQKTLLSIFRDGTLELSLARWKPQENNTLTDKQLTARNEFFKKLHSTFEISQDDLEKQYPEIPPQKWLPHSNEMVELINDLATLPSKE